MIRKTSDGVMLTQQGVNLAYTLIGMLVILVTGALGAARFIVRTQDTPSRTEFHDKLVADTVLHREQTAHLASLDSAMRQWGLDNHRLGCYNAHYPASLCSDLLPVRGQRP